MENRKEKLKRGQRRQKTNNIIKKQAEIAKKHGVKLVSPHKYAKRHAMDCGRPNCGLCGNPRKIYNEKTVQEQKWEQNFGDE